MKNKRNIIFLIAIVISITLSIISISLHIIPKAAPVTATRIYNQSLYGIVEVKAESENVGESFGTGEIISDSGKIVTNAHVVTYTRFGTAIEFEKYFVRFAFEEVYREVKLLKYDSELDFAMLQFNESPEFIKPIKTGDSNTVKAGDNVYAVGNASNYGIGIFKGIVSVPLVNIELDGVTRSVIQCDLTIAAGNSGGALLDENGALIGITTFRTKDMSGNVIYGIVYCIPVNTVLEFINE